MEPIVIRKQPKESIEHLIKLNGTYKIHIGVANVVIESMDDNEMVFVCVNEIWNEV